MTPANDNYEDAKQSPENFTEMLRILDSWALTEGNCECGCQEGK